MGGLIPQADVLATGTQANRHFREIPETFFNLLKAERASSWRRRSAEMAFASTIP
jgi:hypothetical protein